MEREVNMVIVAVKQEYIKGVTEIPASQIAVPAIMLNVTLIEPNLRKLKDRGGLPPPHPWNPCCSDNREDHYPSNKAKDGVN